MLQYIMPPIMTLGILATGIQERSACMFRTPLAP